jgi:dimethylargininase
MTTFAPPARILVRAPGDAYARCLRSDAAAVIDVDAARRQHAAYVAALSDLGLTVDFVPEDAAHPDATPPDACFIEDTAVVLGRSAVLTRPGAESRRGEVAAVGRRLAPYRVIEVMAAPATLDGGDVLRAGEHLFVGLSTRTNHEGLAMLARVASTEGLRVVPIEVRGGLHLKSACTLAGARDLVFDPSIVGADALRELERAGLTCTEAEEPAGANVLALGAAVLVSAAAPRTAASLAARGVNVVVLDVGEMHKGDGALTCLSLRVPSDGCWST